MDMKLEKVQLKDKNLLVNLAQYYHYEFSDLKETDVTDEGLYSCDEMENYFREECFYPFFIKIKGKLAGFVIVKNIKEGSKVFNSIEEFFVLKKYFKQDISKIAAKTIFDTFRGKWKITQLKNNYKSQEFWREVVSEYTADCYSESYDKNRNSVQEFDNSI